MGKKVLNLAGTNLDNLDITLCMALNTFGANHQLTCVIEELSELTKAICKLKRTGLIPVDRIVNEPVCAKMNITESKYYFDLIDEIADVYITVRQIELMYNCSDAVDKKMEEKLQRLASRVAAKHDI
jgi:NTP pyrophosphatase (non-canonical NTP hydrolase)